MLGDVVRGNLYGDNVKEIFIWDVCLGILFWDNVKGCLLGVIVNLI